MYRTDHVTGGDDPGTTPGSATPNRFFIGGNAIAGQAATIVEAEWLNMVQEELCNVVTNDDALGDLVLNKGLRNQLLLGIRREIAAASIYVLKSGDVMTGGLTAPYLESTGNMEADGNMSAGLIGGTRQMSIGIGGEGYPYVQFTPGYAMIFNPALQLRYQDYNQRSMFRCDAISDDGTAGGDFWIYGNLYRFNGVALPLATVAYARGLAEILQLEPQGTGTLARLDPEVLMTVIPECVREEDQGLATTDGPLILTLINAVHEIAGRLDALEGLTPTTHPA
jgi:hypothetical protein